MNHYGQVSLENYETHDGVTYWYGLKWYDWDPETGEIMEPGYWLTAEKCIKAVIDLSKTHHIPRVMISRIYKSLRMALPSAKFRKQQIEIFVNVMQKYAPWIDQAAILALTRAL